MRGIKKDNEDVVESSVKINSVHTINVKVNFCDNNILM